MDENILKKHPQGKAGVNISRAKFDQVKACIVESLKQGDKTFTHLSKDTDALLASHPPRRTKH